VYNELEIKNDMTKERMVDSPWRCLWSL